MPPSAINKLFDKIIENFKEIHRETYKNKYKKISGRGVNEDIKQIANDTNIDNAIDQSNKYIDGKL